MVAQNIFYSKAGFAKAKKAQVKAQARGRSDAPIIGMSLRLSLLKNKVKAKQEKAKEAEKELASLMTLDASEALDSFGSFGAAEDDDAPVSPDNKEAPREEDVGPR